jgi:D-sedoheptulose 7-phosphate isomerase
MKSCIASYLSKLKSVIDLHDWQSVELFGEMLLEAVKSGKHVFICGNGGSAGNAVHLANDFLYGIEPGGKAMKVEALSSNTSVLTCLGNDIGYENIFSHQLKVKAEQNDILIVLSGSGNSANIVQALMQADELNMKTCAILGFCGGKAKQLADCVIHFDVNDMQISEDLQLMVGHMVMQYLHTQLKC